MSSPAKMQICLAVFALALVGNCFAYESSIHQKLTFLAAKQLNRCLADSDIPSVDALQVRVIAKANARQAEANFFVRLFRWSYYDRSGVGDRDVLWVIDTRFHEHFDQQVRQLGGTAQTDPTDAYRRVGRVLNYVQEVTSPAQAAPVYTARWWRLNLRDKFDNFPVDQARVAAATERSCPYVLANPGDYHSILKQTADDTLTAVQAPMLGLPASWEAFWTLNEDPGKFGEYGPAGNNFGRNASFSCGATQRCVLLREDPLYRDFALQRHISAVVASMRIMLALQRQRSAAPPSSGPPPRVGKPAATTGQEGA